MVVSKNGGGGAAGPAEEGVSHGDSSARFGQRAVRCQNARLVIVGLDFQKSSPPWPRSSRATPGRVFPRHGRSAVYGAVDAIAPAGTHWRPHDSRRAVVTAVLRQTGDPALARKYVAHVSLKTTLRYRVVEPLEGGSQVRHSKHRH